LGTIQTVLGPIKPDVLGIADIHEHLICSPPSPWRDQDPDLVLDDYQKATEELQSFKDSGGSALVEWSTLDYGRDVLTLQCLSIQTGVHIVAATGYLKGRYCAPFVAEKSIANLVDLLVDELTEGVGDRGVRPGVIKAGSGPGSMNAEDEKILRAAARAHHRTGVPIVTHTETGTEGLEQLSLLREEGVNASRVIVGHVDRNLDLASLLSLAETGAYLAFDSVGKEKYGSDKTRICLIRKLLDGGFGHQILLGSDLGRRSYWVTHGGNPGLAYLLSQFVPWMKIEGIPHSAIQDILVNNPREALQIRRREAWM